MKPREPGSPVPMPIFIPGRRKANWREFPPSMPAFGLSFFFCSRRAMFGHGLWLATVLALSSLFTALGQDVIELGNKPVSFTNLLGRAYDNVQLERATMDGLVYSQTNTFTVGLVRYPDLATNFLAGLKIPETFLAKAARHQQELDQQKKEFDQAAYFRSLQNLANIMVNTNDISTNNPSKKGSNGLQKTSSPGNSMATPRYYRIRTIRR